MNPSDRSINDPLSPQGILEVTTAFMKSRILLTAYELGLFTAVGDGRRASADVARALHADGRATDRLMNALCAIGLLEKKDGLFANIPLGSRFLVEGRPDFLAGLMHSVHRDHHSVGGLDVFENVFEPRLHGLLLEPRLSIGHQVAARQDLKTNARSTCSAPGRFSKKAMRALESST